MPITNESRDDAALAARIREGDAQALRVLVARDHGVANLLAEAVGVHDLTTIWNQIVDRMMNGGLTEGLRPALLATVLAVAPQDMTPSDLTARSASGSAAFIPAGDRWEGWWTDGGEPTAWPDGYRPGRADVQAALQQIPFDMRVLLVLRDVAGLTPDDATRITYDVCDQLADLDDARDIYFTALDDMVASHGRA